MAEELLQSVLSGTIKLNQLFRWLLDTNEIDNYELHCTQGDFLLYFLNYIHEDCIMTRATTVTPIKLNTPKRLKTSQLSVSLDSNSTISDKKPIRRLELFPCLNKPSNSETNDVKAANTSIIQNESTNTLLNDSNKSNELKEFYMSPVSPLYSKNASFSTPKTAKKQSTVTSAQKSVDRSHNLCLADFMVQKGGSGKKKTSPMKDKCTKSKSLKVRRINPTNVNHSQTIVGSVNRNSFSFDQQPEEEIQSDDFDNHRSLLAEERLKIVARTNSANDSKSPSSVNAAIKPQFLCQTNSANFIEAEYRSVTSIERLDILIEIYVKLLDNNLVLNKTSELYFIVSLLVAKQQQQDGDDCATDSCQLLGSVHNCVYFACRVLHRQNALLAVLDRATLNLLRQKSNLKQFDVRLLPALKKIYDQKSREKCAETEDKFRALKSDVEVNVCFISDTDNRENFPSDPSFHAFRKQRDLFYEILRIWETNHMLAGWKFAVALGGKIRTLLNLHNDPANFMHLSRLFKSQLLSTCGKNRSLDEPVSENQLSFLSNIPNINAEKLSKLKDRLVTKDTSNGITPLPTFPGSEEFYRDFLVIASNPCFTKHLTDIFVHEILELNDTNFVGADLDESGADVEPATKKSFAICLKSLRTLAKFVGFIESLPYRNSDSYLVPSASSEHLLSTQIRVRYQTVPAIHIKRLLLEAMRDKKLTMAVPWVTTFIAMLDFTTLRLPYYQEVYDILFEIYFSKIGHANVRNVMVIKLCLGWLFELPNFPEGLYVSWITSKMSLSSSERLIHAQSAMCHVNGDLSVQSLNKCTSTPIASTSGGGGAILFNSLHSVNINNSLHNTNSSGGNNSANSSAIKDVDGVDDLDITDDAILYLCCPFLVEIKTLLCNDSVASKRGSVKHITPVSSVQSTRNIHRKQLEMQLEEAFFNGQPISMRKTVDFVSERVASACVKHICNEIVPNSKKEALERVKTMLHNVIKPDKAVTDAEKKQVPEKVRDIAEESLKRLRTVCDREVKSMCDDRIASSIITLLANDVLKATSDTCVTIATRMCLERVAQWTMSHVNSAIYTKDFNSEVKRAFNQKDESAKFHDYKPPIILPAGGKDIKHNPDAYSPVTLINAYKNLTIDLLETPQSVTQDQLMHLIHESIKTKEERCDLNHLSWFTTLRLFLELFLISMTHRPDLLSTFEAFYKKALGFIQEYAVVEKEELFKKIICRRNVMLLWQSKNREKTWTVYTQFLVDLVTKDVINCASFEHQCVSLYQEEWHQTIQTRLGTCFKDVLEGLKGRDKLTPEFDFIISWLADYCIELDT